MARYFHLSHVEYHKLSDLHRRVITKEEKMLLSAKYHADITPVNATPVNISRTVPPFRDTAQKRSAPTQLIHGQSKRRSQNTPARIVDSEPFPRRNTDPGQSKRMSQNTPARIADSESFPRRNTDPGAPLTVHFSSDTSYIDDFNYHDDLRAQIPSDDVVSAQINDEFLSQSTVSESPHNSSVVLKWWWKRGVDDFVQRRLLLTQPLDAVFCTIQALQNSFHVADNTAEDEAGTVIELVRQLAREDNGNRIKRSLSDIEFPIDNPQKVFVVLGENNNSFG